MSKLSSFIIKKKLEKMVAWPGIWKMVFNLFLSVSIGIGYGILTGIIGDILIEKGIVSLLEFLTFYCLIISIIILSVDIFPVLKQPVINFKSYHPVSYHEKIKVAFISDFLRWFLMFLICFQTFIVISSDELGLPEGLFISFFLLSVYLLNRYVRSWIFFKIPRQRLTSFLLAVGILISSMSLLVIDAFLVLIGISIGIFLLCLGIYIYLECFKKEKGRVVVSFYRKGVMFRILGNKNVRILLILAFVFKLLILIPSAIIYNGSGKYIFGSEWFIWLFLTPIALFTYIGYNFFGVNRNFFFTHAIRENSLKSLLILYISSYSYLLAADAIIFLSYIVFTKLISGQIIFFYVTSSLLLVITAFPMSILAPIIKDKYYSMDVTKYGAKNISLLSLLLSAIIVTSSMAISTIKYYWLIYPGICIIVLTIVLMKPVSFSKGRKLFFIKLKGS